jgi:hypothetical protein
VGRGRLGPPASAVTGPVERCASPSPVLRDRERCGRRYVVSVQYIPWPRVLARASSDSGRWWAGRMVAFCAGRSREAGCPSGRFGVGDRLLVQNGPVLPVHETPHRAVDLRVRFRAGPCPENATPPRTEFRHHRANDERTGVSGRAGNGSRASWTRDRAASPGRSRAGMVAVCVGVFSLWVFRLRLGTKNPRLGTRTPLCR